MKDLHFIEAYSRLTALQKNIPQYDVPVELVNEFHQILDLLEKEVGELFTNFRIPSSQVRPIITGGNYVTGEKHYSTQSYCEHNFFLVKVDGAITMFELLSQYRTTGKTPIGFKSPTT